MLSLTCGGRWLLTINSVNLINLTYSQAILYYATCTKIVIMWHSSWVRVCYIEWVNMESVNYGTKPKIFIISLVTLWFMQKATIIDVIWNFCSILDSGNPRHPGRPAKTGIILDYEPKLRTHHVGWADWAGKFW